MSNICDATLPLHFLSYFCNYDVIAHLLGFWFQCIQQNCNIQQGQSKRGILVQKFC
eukprot:TRINITY_DN16145_c0_g1_i1.p1 TRINITY_DN16145_c0_g1~~TRINITY_DN16145_c0_g1_i1.p1  ORF type:complete len:56 (-),score=1.43 TRINITY_DN16145_c0_g1_i1:401-568(-)